jgi:hypothetical protein
MLEDRQTAIVFKVIVQPHPMHGLAQDARQRRLTNFDGFSAQIGAVQFKQIKCIQECPWLVPPVTSTWNAATPLSSQQTTSPSIRQERTFRWLTACTTSGNRGGGPIVAPTGDQPDAHGATPSHEAVAVVLDLVNPSGPGRRLSAGEGRQGSIKAEREVDDARNAFA